ncbi:phosphate ABC transporter permease PstA [Marinivivus vitaminiproducens]|nr:phosphate ABC transporter permease PstA [Geminicoccaceae bacterium SCSIO 64248]
MVWPRPRRLGAEEQARHTGKRYAAESRFKMVGLAAVLTSMGLLVLLLSTIVGQGFTAFWQTSLSLDVNLDAAEIDPQGTRNPQDIMAANYAGLINDALYAKFPEVTSRSDRRDLRGLVSVGAPGQVAQYVLDNPDVIGTTQRVTVLTDDVVDQFVKGKIDRDLPESARPISDQTIGWIDRLEQDGAISSNFNTLLFENGDSREPELAGIWGAIVGSFWMMIIVLALAVPIGVSAAIYLEEFAPKKSKLVDLIEVNINNLAAVPSIVFGLLGLAVFLNTLHLPRSAPLVGALTITLMTLPIIVVATRAALRAVPPSIRDAALGVGASKIQTVGHHVLPLALPGIMTGTIIGMAHALGETAPLIMIGMVAFIVDIPSGPLSPATVLPVQIYIWADSPERAFAERTAAGIIVLLAFLITMNALAVILRKRFERKW